MAFQKLTTEELKALVDAQAAEVTKQLQEGEYGYIMPVFAIFDPRKVMVDLEIGELDPDQDTRMKDFNDLGKGLAKRFVPVIGTLMIHEVNLQSLVSEEKSTGIAIIATTMAGEIVAKVLELTKGSPKKVVGIVFEFDGKESDKKMEANLMRSFWRGYLLEIREMRKPILN